MVYQSTGSRRDLGIVYGSMLQASRLGYLFSHQEIVDTLLLHKVVVFVFVLQSPVICQIDKFNNHPFKELVAGVSTS